MKTNSTLGRVYWVGLLTVLVAICLLATMDAAAMSWIANNWSYPTAPFSCTPVVPWSGNPAIPW
jgi:hypothetical protein